MELTRRAYEPAKADRRPPAVPCQGRGSTTARVPADRPDACSVERLSADAHDLTTCALKTEPPRGRPLRTRRASQQTLLPPPPANLPPIDRRGRSERSGRRALRSTGSQACLSQPKTRAPGEAKPQDRPMVCVLNVARAHPLRIPFSNTGWRDDIRSRRRWRSFNYRLAGPHPARPHREASAGQAGSVNGGGVGIVDFPARGLADVPAGLTTRIRSARSIFRRWRASSTVFCSSEIAPSASPGATTMTPAKVRFRFAARISSANRAEPQIQTISGRSSTTQSFGPSEGVRLRRTVSCALARQPRAASGIRALRHWGCSTVGGCR